MSFQVEIGSFSGGTLYPSANYANKDHKTVNSKDESSNSEDSDATSPYALFLSSDLSDSDEKPKLKKRQSKLPT